MLLGPRVFLVFVWLLTNWYAAFDSRLVAFLGWLFLPYTSMAWIYIFFNNAGQIQGGYPPDEADFRSIVDVLEKHGRSVSLAILGKFRRRWLERPPRDPASVHPNRLMDVLARMVKDGVLTKQGARYVPGPRYAAYLEPVGVG